MRDTEEHRSSLALVLYYDRAFARGEFLGIIPLDDYIAEPTYMELVRIRQHVRIRRHAR